jgi:small conductance mechanosensitive channel
MNLITLNQEKITNISVTTLRVVSILLLTWLARRILRFLIFRLKKKIKETPLETTEQRKKRIDTLSSLLITSSSIILVLVALMVILSEVGVNILPLLTSVGVVGLGIGMGAKSLVSDMLAGFFVLLENQFNVGDVVKLGGKWKGTVKEISLRTIILEDKDGKEYIIPNSSINTVVIFPEED